MNVQELKKKIEDHTLGDQPLILKYKDSTFLAHQYIDAIAKFKELPIYYINEIEQTTSGCLNVMFIDTYTSMMYCDYLTNLIIVCKKVEEGGEEFMVELPELEKWQIEDYVASQLPGLETKYAKWLCEVARYNIDRLQVEVEKLGVFAKGSQRPVFELLNESKGYVDLGNLESYDLVSAVMRKDMETIKEYFTEQLDIDALGLTSLLIRNFRQVLDIQINPQATADSLGMSFKQYKAIQHSCGFYTNEQLMKIYRFLLSVDQKLKVGILEYDELKDYVIPHLLAI